jgi:hypothetical protein
MNNKSTRRSFFQMALLSAAVIPFVTKATKLFAADACPSTPPVGKIVARSDEGMGKTLEYVSDASVSKNVKYKTGNNCGNCKFYNSAKADGGFAPCTMMGMKYVTNCGWCKSYLVKV